MRRARTDEAGSALISVLIVMMLLMAITGAMHTGVISETSLRGSHARATAGFYAAEAGVNRGMGDYRNIFLSYQFPRGSDFDQKTLSVGPRQVKYQLQPICEALQADGTCPAENRVIGAGRPFAGLSAQYYRYAAQATSEIHTGDIETSLGTEFEVHNVPLFQFLAFYQNDLEILPGPVMNLHGPIRTNGSLYLNSEGNTLTITDCRPDRPVPNFCPNTVPTVHIAAAGNVWRGKKQDGACAGTVTISKLSDSNNDNVLDTLNMACPKVSESDAQLSAWLGSIRARQAVVGVPQPNAMARMSADDQSAWQRAELRIVLDLDAKVAGGLAPIVVQDVNGNVDATLNPRFQTFMAARPGAVFYSDVPENGNSANNNTCNTTGSYCNPVNYGPDFAIAGVPNSNLVYACPWNDAALNLYPVANCPTYILPEVYNGSLGTLTTFRRGGFYNNREAQTGGGWVYMLNVNVKALVDWNRSQLPANQLFDPADTTDWGILLFLSVKGPNATGIANPRYGVRVYGSPNLGFPDPQPADPTGLTVVSDQALYVEGHYNAGTAGFSKVPAALMGDTINVLSAGWSGQTCPANWSTTFDCNNTGTHRCCNDRQSRKNLDLRPASFYNGAAQTAASTTVNAAFLGSVDNTGAGAYNGGLENFPRFHETWSAVGGTALNYRGSFVSLGLPLHNNGPWCGTGGGCNIYNPPVRAWDYDTAFQNVINLPPWTPRAIFVEQILFTENFR